MRMRNKESLDFYKSLRYAITLYEDDDGGYVAEVKDLPGCITQGDSLEEARRMLDEARELWLETAYELGRPIPLPSEDEEFSGRVLVRMPKHLHASLSQEAKANESSLNQHIVSLLSERNAYHQVLSHLHAIQIEQGAEALLPKTAERTQFTEAPYRHKAAPQKEGGKWKKVKPLRC